jgi:hypothetical protein
MTPKIAGRGTGASLFATCLAEVREQLCPDPPATIALTDEERAAIAAAVYRAQARTSGWPPLTPQFLALPPQEQLRLWTDTIDRGGWWPCTEPIPERPQGEGEGRHGHDGGRLPYGPRELGEGDPGAAGDGDVGPPPLC